MRRKPRNAKTAVNESRPVATDPRRPSGNFPLHRRRQPRRRPLVLTRIKERVKELRDNPHIGGPGRVPGTRELVISKTSYLAPYQVDGDTLQILRVYHGSRQWPESFK